MFTARVLVDGVCRTNGIYMSRKAADIAAGVQLCLIQGELANDGKTHTFEEIVFDNDAPEGHDLPPCGAMFGGEFVEFAPNS